jgi:thiamine biosynthesis lipoprotein ApbE
VNLSETATWRALGTDVRLVVTDPEALPMAQRMLHFELCALDKACSRFRQDSELVQLIDAAQGRPRWVSPLLAEAITVALRAAELTDGDVDPTVGEAMNTIGYDRDISLLKTKLAKVPSWIRVTVRSQPAPGWQLIEWNPDTHRLRVPVGVRLDFGATAKAMSADRAAQSISSELACGVLVSLGGDVAVGGQAPSGGWQIRVQDSTGDPSDSPEGPHSTVAVFTGAVATSSTSARRWIRGGIPMHHIVDPRIGLPVVSPWRTVSVAAMTCVDANTASTAAIVRGEVALTWLRSLGLPARLVRTDGLVETVAGWPSEESVAA